MLCNHAVNATLDRMQDFSECTMTAGSTYPVVGPPVSLRERKKLATRRQLRRAALN